MLKLDRLLSDEHRAELDALIAKPGTRILDARQWVRERGYRAGRDTVAAYVRRQRGGQPLDGKPTKLERMIKPEDRAAVEAMVADPNVTIDSAHERFKEMGYPVGRGTVHRQMKYWRGQLDEVRACARFARNAARITADLGPGFQGSALLGFEQVLLERAYDLRRKKELTAGELTGWVDALERVTTARGNIDAARRGNAGDAARPPDGKTPPAGAPRRLINGVEIANAVRTLMGVPLPGEPLPKPPPPAVSPAPSLLPAPLLPLPPGEGRGEGV